MATQQRTPVETYQCPECDDELATNLGSWQCLDCGYVPGHGSD